MNRQFSNQNPEKIPKIRIPDWVLGFWRNGFTLIETIVALSVIITAAVGPVTLVTRGLLSSAFSRNGVIAVQLAQEGIELVRLVRDNNVACIAEGSAERRRDSDQELPDNTMAGEAGVDVNDLLDGRTRIVCGTAEIVMPRLSTSCSQPLLLDEDGTYWYQSGAPSIFTRCVKIVTPLPHDQGGDPDIDPEAQMDVIATVNWDEHGTGRSIELRERMYDWR